MSGVRRRGFSWCARGLADLRKAGVVSRTTAKRSGGLILLWSTPASGRGAIEELNGRVVGQSVDVEFEKARGRRVAPSSPDEEAEPRINRHCQLTAGQRGEAGYSNYAASKGGQISFTKSLASELAPAIRVNCVAPGWVDTELNTEVFSDTGYKQQVTQAIPLQRLATADDIALSVIFLASGWSRHITGEVLNVNGGAVLCAKQPIALRQPRIGERAPMAEPPPPREQS